MDHFTKEDEHELLRLAESFDIVGLKDFLKSRRKSIDPSISIWAECTRVTRRFFTESWYRYEDH